MEHTCSQVQTITEIKGKVALTNNDITYMKLEISEIKSDVKDIRKDVRDFIDSVNKTYATKEEMNGIKLDVEKIKDNTNSSRVEWIKTYGGWIAAIIGGLFTLLSIWINK